MPINNLMLRTDGMDGTEPGVPPEKDMELHGARVQGLGHELTSLHQTYGCYECFSLMMT